MADDRHLARIPAAALPADGKRAEIAGWRLAVDVAASKQHQPRGMPGRKMISFCEAGRLRGQFFYWTKASPISSDWIRGELVTSVQSIQSELDDRRRRSKKESSI